MYKRKEFTNAETLLSNDIRSKLEEAETLIDQIADNKEKELSLFFLEEAMLHANLAITVAGLNQ